MEHATTENRFSLMLQLAKGIDGFMSDINVAIWDIFLTAQAKQYVQGDLLEIGVYKGRSASVLCQHKRPDEELWLVDFSDFLAEAKQNLAALSPPGVRYLHSKSSALWRNPDVLTRRRGFRWIHIDGEHTGHAVTNDLNIAADLLSNEGLLCVDDFFNASYPQITAATFMWLASRPFELEMILCGENKAYFCRPTFARIYLDYIKNHFANELKTRSITDRTLFKTAPLGDYNSWGIGRRWLDRDYYGLDENPDLIS